MKNGLGFIDFGLVLLNLFSCSQDANLILSQKNKTIIERINGLSVFNAMVNAPFQMIFSLLLIFLFISNPVSANTTDPTSFYINFDDINLSDQNGHTFKTNQLESKISIFNFVYTECVSVCSVQTSQLLKIYESLSPEIKKDIRLVSISLDPIKDNPQKLKSFAKNLNADVEGWVFLSTNFKDLINLASRITLFREYHGKTIYEDMNPEKKKSYKLEDHKAGLWLIDADGHVRQRYAGNPIEINRVVNEINILHRLQFAKSAAVNKQK